MSLNFIIEIVYTGDVTVDWVASQERAAPAITLPLRRYTRERTKRHKPLRVQQVTYL